MSTYTTTPGSVPRQSIRVDLAELRDVIACRRGVSAIREADSADQACQRARILLAQHRDNVTFPDDCRMFITPSSLPRIDPFAVARALCDWAETHEIGLAA